MRCTRVFAKLMSVNLPYFPLAFFANFSLTESLTCAGKERQALHSKSMSSARGADLELWSQQGLSVAWAHPMNLMTESIHSGVAPDGFLGHGSSSAR